jgi:hypothetical protein
VRCIGGRDAWSRAACGEAPGAPVQACLPAKRGSGHHGVGEDGNRNAVGVTARVRGGPYPTVRRKVRAQRNVPLRQVPIRGTVPSRSARKGRHRGPRRTCSATQSAGCPCEVRQVGKDGVAAVRRNIGPRGLCPSRKVAREGPRPRGPLECAYNKLLIASGFAGHLAFAGTRGCCTLSRPVTAAGLFQAWPCVFISSRSQCPLCLCGSFPPCPWTDRTSCRTRCGWRW